MTMNKTLLFAIVVAAGLASVDAIGAEPEATGAKSEDKAAKSEMQDKKEEMSRELEWREFPTDERGSEAREFWDVSDSEKLIPEAESERLRHHDRAINEKDFEALAESSPGVEVDRAEVTPSAKQDEEGADKSKPKVKKSK